MPKSRAEFLTKVFRNVIYSCLTIKKGWLVMKKRLFVVGLLLVVLGVILALYVKHNKPAGAVATPASAVGVQQKADKGLAGLDPACVGNCGKEYQDCLNGISDCETPACKASPECWSECLIAKDWARTQCDQGNSECLDTCKPKK